MVGTGIGGGNSCSQVDPWNKRKGEKTAAGIVEMEFCYVRLWKNVTAEKQSLCFPAYQLEFK